MITWDIEDCRGLIGCGIDAERVERFEKLVGKEHPWPIVFSKRETEHASLLVQPSLGLCASFCCKEALVKALEHSFRFPECEFLYDGADGAHQLHLSSGLCERFGIGGTLARVSSPRAGEVMIVVYLFGGPDA